MRHVRNEVPGEGHRKRGASSRQVCGQGRKLGMLETILGSAALIVWGTGEPWRLKVRSSIYVYIRLQGMAAIEMWGLRHTDKK